jgi:HTH domain
MKFFDINNKLEQLDQLLRQNKTGPATQLADRLGVCERTVHNLFDILRTYGAKIGYNKCRRSYGYKNKTLIQFFKCKIENDDKIKGGKNLLHFFSSLQDFCRLPPDLCDKLTNEDEQSDARGFGRSEFGD